MTTAQIKKINVPMKEWVSLNKFRTILLSNDGHLSTGYQETQFYFDDTNELMFVRHTYPYLMNNKAK